MQKTWIAMCTVAVLAAAGGLVAGRAFAEDEVGGGMPLGEKASDGHALAKALMANKWTTKSTSEWGGGEGTNSYRLGAGKTLLVQDYDSKGPRGAFSGHGVYKFSADGKTATLWWFTTMNSKPDEFTGPATDAGFELSGNVTMMGSTMKAVIKLAKKGEGFEFTYTMDGKGLFTDVYTKAK